MKPFIHPDFILETKTAKTLYHDFAETMPIIDYHCHLSPEKISADYTFRNITEAWIDGDHYKWRGMRANGIDENLITGKAGARDIFRAWAATVPYTIRNPLYHWTHLELAQVFGITDTLLNEDTADTIFDRCNEMLASPEFSVRGILKKMRVETVCTTDDPTHSLEYHAAYAAEEKVPFAMYPAWRPDKALNIDKGIVFTDYICSIENAAGLQINSFDTLLYALQKRHDFFHTMGCRLSDYGLDTVYADEFTIAQADAVFKKSLSGQAVTEAEVRIYKSALLHYCALMDHAAGWAIQLHIGVIRNNNSRMFKRLGPDAGFDSIGDFSYAQPLARFLDGLDAGNALARTVLYNINPRDNALIASMCGNFNDASIPGKIQFGSGWWFLDQKQGMEDQINTLSSLGLLSRFIGMTTDSRSFLSFPRHDYFRRILCNMLGSDMEKGLIPGDMTLIGGMVKDICYYNAKNYFKPGE